MDQLVLTLISGICISGVAAYLGTLMLSKKMTVVAGPLAHLALPGVAMAIIYGFSVSLGAFPFVILGAVLIWYLEKTTKLPMENLAAIIFAFGVGTALLILPIGEAEEALVGSITAITLPETLIVIIVCLSICYLVRSIYKKMMLINIHEDLATVEGVCVDRYNLLYLLSIAIVVALAVYLVGGLITVALIAIPPAAARNISKDLYSYKIWAVFFGVVSTIIGIFIARLVHLPAGPLIIITGAVVFVLTVLIQIKLSHSSQNNRFS